MQTFLCYQDFAKSAACLDDRRLNNQINEALIILRTLTGWYAKNGGKGWPNHPFVKRWQGYEAALCNYGLELLSEFAIRDQQYIGERAQRFIDALMFNLKQYEEWYENTFIYPEWLTEDFCAEHRRILLEKDFAFYSTKFDSSELEKYNVLA